MLVIAGHVLVRPEQRHDFVMQSTLAAEQALGTDGCLAFVVAEDPLARDRAHVYQRWVSAAHAAALGGDPSGYNDLSGYVVRAELRAFDVAGERAADLWWHEVAP